VVIANLTFSVYGSELAAAASTLTQETRAGSTSTSAPVYSQTAGTESQA
jgi:hypothetical protein